MDADTCHRWVVPAEALIGLDAVAVRDMLVECFTAAQRETFARAKESLGMPIDEESLRRSVTGAVRAAFKSAGGDFDAPTKSSIILAIDVLAASAAAWGTPADIVDHHHQQIEVVVSRLAE